MCPPILGVIIGIVGSFAQAAMVGQQASAQAKIEQQQLKIEMENERISAMQKTNDRMEQFRKEEASNLAALSATGLQTNLSYEQGIAPYNTKVAHRDMDREFFNSGQTVGRKKYEIAVAGWKAKTTSRNAFMTAGIESIGAIGSHIAKG